MLSDGEAAYQEEVKPNGLREEQGWKREASSTTCRMLIAVPGEVLMEATEQSSEQDQEKKYRSRRLVGTCNSSPMKMGTHIT